MTKVVVRRRPLAAVQDLAHVDAHRLRLGDVITVPLHSWPWWARAIQWLSTRVLRLPAPFAMQPRWTVIAVDHETGRVTMVAE